MNCANHEEVSAVAFCRECGKPMCPECQRPALGSVFCAEHAGVTANMRPMLPIPESARTESPRSEYKDSPYAAGVSMLQADPKAMPVLALILGFIPGVGALYNGQYAKGLIHAVVFGLLISLTANAPGGLEPLLGISISAWVFYMAFEAFHTAKKRRLGDSVEEFSSLFDIKPSQGRFPVGAILLIGVGFVLLLETTGLIGRLQLERFWPVGLIAFGFYLLYSRVAGDRSANGVQR